MSNPALSARARHFEIMNKSVIDPRDVDDEITLHVLAVNAKYEGDAAFISDTLSRREA
jgi:hypothetical protein